jgi:5-methylcytosine-specific restriction endonuclease McrA
MPIHPSQQHLYPKDWKQISLRIRVERDGNRCKWCGAVNGKPHPITGSKVVLHVAHLDHDPANCADENLASLCQRCHNWYDAPMRRLNAKTRKSIVGTRSPASLPLALPSHSRAQSEARQVIVARMVKRIQLLINKKKR